MASWFDNALSMEKFAAAISPPPNMKRSIMEWLDGIYRPWHFYSMIRSSVEMMSGSMSSSVGWLAVSMIDKGASKEDISEMIVDEMEGIEETFAENGGEDFINTKKGMDLSESYHEIQSLLEEILAIYGKAERDGIGVSNTMPAQAEIPLDLNGWQHEDAYRRIVLQNPHNEKYLNSFSILIVTADPNSMKTRAGMMTDGRPAIELGVKSMKSRGALESSLDHELVHFCQYLMNTALHGLDENGNIAGWSYGTPSKEMRDGTVDQKRLDEEMGDREIVKRVLDDREFSAMVSGSLVYARRAAEGLSQTQKRQLVKDIMYGGGSPWMGAERKSLADMAAKALRVEWLYDSNHKKWESAFNALLKEIA